MQVVKIHPHPRLCVQQRCWARASALLSPHLLKQREELIMASKLLAWLPAHRQVGAARELLWHAAPSGISKALVTMNTDRPCYNLAASPAPFFLLLISASPAEMPIGAKVAKEQQRAPRECFSAGNQSCMQVAQLPSFISAPLKQCRECAHNLRGSCWMQPASLTATFFQISAPVCCLIDL